MSCSTATTIYLAPPNPIHEYFQTIAKSAECHAAPTAGLLWFLITLTTLLRNLHSKHRHTPWEMFSEHPWRVAVYTTMSPKSQVGPLIFSIGFLITKRINSDLFRPYPPELDSRSVPFSVFGGLVGGSLCGEEKHNIYIEIT